MVLGQGLDGFFMSRRCGSSVSGEGLCLSEKVLSIFVPLEGYYLSLHSSRGLRFICRLPAPWASGAAMWPYRDVYGSGSVRLVRNAQRRQHMYRFAVTVRAGDDMTVRFLRFSGWRASDACRKRVLPRMKLGSRSIVQTKIT